MSMTLLDLFHEKAMMPFPTIVCLVGSTRFFQAYQDANLRETPNGKIVSTIGCDTKADHDLQRGPIDKSRLDIVHLFKIELADEVSGPDYGWLYWQVNQSRNRVCTDIGQDAPLVGIRGECVKTRRAAMYQNRRAPTYTLRYHLTCRAARGHFCTRNLTRKAQPCHFVPACFPPASRLLPVFYPPSYVMTYAMMYISLQCSIWLCIVGRFTKKRGNAMERKLRLLSRCSSIGGIDFVWSHQLGRESTGQVEIEAVLQKQWPDVEKRLDIPTGCATRWHLGAPRLLYHCRSPHAKKRWWIVAFLRDVLGLAA